ncbi:MAG: serine protease [Rikenellaceae bacterium]
MKELSRMEQLCFNTVRIETTNARGQAGSGTGFIVVLDVDGKMAPLVVTNKHVIAGNAIGRIVLTVADSEGNPNYEDHFPAVFNGGLGENWIEHPDPNIDLCVMPLNPLVDMVKNRYGKNLFIKAFSSEHIMTKSRTSDIDVGEDILMIGYPNGLWDSVNNMPIIRKGILATNVSLDYNGRREFVIDAACFPGSSGSPVFICNSGGRIDKKGNVEFGGNRLILLGVLYAGPQYTVAGRMRVVNIPTAQQVVQPISSIPNNLGYVIKADALFDFIPIIKEILRTGKINNE